jgi:hypothetical protein
MRNSEVSGQHRHGRFDGGRASKTAGVLIPVVKMAYELDVLRYSVHRIKHTTLTMLNRSEGTKLSAMR